jgi:hypothetical protein
MIRDIRALINSRDDIKTGKDVETLGDQMEEPRFTCPVCDDMFKTRKKAIKCRDQPYDDGGLTVGTVVVVPGKSHMCYALEDPWLAFIVEPNPDADSHFTRAGYRVPYFVVTAIHTEHRNAHRCVVTLVTLCEDKFTVGWNPATGDGHHAMFRIDGGKHCDATSTWLEVIEPYLAECNPSPKMLEEAARLARVGISCRYLL